MSHKIFFLSRFKNLMKEWAVGSYLVMKITPRVTGYRSCWNLLESTPDRIPLDESSHKWNRMPFIISYSKIEI